MAKKVEESESELNFEMLARKELAQLQRQYRVMETDRQNYIQGKGRNANRQGRMLEYLRTEREDLMLDIHNALSIPNQKKDKESEAIIGSMLIAYFKCIEEIQAQMDEITEMEAQVDKTAKHVVAQKLKAQAMFGRSMTVGQVGKRLRVLENRKYHATTLFDTKVTSNSMLRHDINNSLMERGRFHDRYRKLKRQIAAVKHKMLIVVDNALMTYEGREEAVMKIHMLRERNDKESQQHVLEIKEYQRVFHHDQKLRAFMEVKNKPRDVVERAEDRKLRLTAEKERYLDDLIRSYKKSFAQLLKLAQTKDVETLLQQYLSQEQANFSSFKFITDLNNETCVLEEAIKRLKGEIEEVATTARQTKREHGKSLKELNKVFEIRRTVLDQLLKEWETTVEHMNKIIHAVDVVFDRAGCQNAPVIQLLGNRSGILPRNLSLCLKVLEHRIGELQYNRNLLEVKKALLVDKAQVAIKPGVWAPGKKPAPTGGPFKPKVILTGQLAGDVEEDDEESERQLSMRRMTYEEIRDLYKSKMTDSPAIGMPQELEETSSAVRLDSMSNIQTKPKFGPIIKPQKPVASSRETSPTNKSNKKASTPGGPAPASAPKPKSQVVVAGAASAIIMDDDDEEEEEEEDWSDLDGIDTEE